IDAKTGKLLWYFPNARYDVYAVIPTPVVQGDLVYVTAGYNIGCNLLQITKDAAGKFSAKDLYNAEAQRLMKNEHGGVVLVDEYIYGNSDGVGVAVDVHVHQHHAAVLVLHQPLRFGVVQILGAELAGRVLGNLEKIAADVVAGGHVHQVALHHRRGNDRVDIVPRVGEVPQQLARLGIDAGDAAAFRVALEGGVDVLLHAANGRRDDGRIGGGVPKLLAPPQDR